MVAFSRYQYRPMIVVLILWKGEEKTQPKQRIYLILITSDGALIFCQMRFRLNSKNSVIRYSLVWSLTSLKYHWLLDRLYSVDRNSNWKWECNSDPSILCHWRYSKLIVWHETCKFYRSRPKHWKYRLAFVDDDETIHRNRARESWGWFLLLILHDHWDYWPRQ